MKYFKDPAGSSDPRIKKAYFSWRNQKYRCYNKNNRCFKNYGARGIRVEYSKHEFIAWWIENFERRDWVDPTCGRIDHDGNYCFSNIEMQERSENVREVHRRRGNPGGTPKRKVEMLDRAGKLIAVFPSTREAARAIGSFQASVIRRLQGTVEQKSMILRYAEAA